MATSQAFKNHQLILPESFYTRNNVLEIAQDLLGKYLCTYINGQYTCGKIVETEAYRHYKDNACHSKNGTRNKRNNVMYEQGGVAYVYLCYGIHWLFNVVTNIKNKPDAILIRAVEPIEGINTMQERRNLTTTDTRITAGPGCLTQAMGINRTHNGTNLQTDDIWIEDRQEIVPPSHIVAGYRVGIAYAKEDALLPWRYSIKDNKWVSKAKPKYPQYSKD